MLAEISLVPVGSGEDLGDAVAEVLDIIDQSGVDYVLTPMGTVLEGEWDQIMGLVKKCHDKMRQSHRRVLTNIKIDDREGAKQRLTGKVREVEEKTGRQLNKLPGQDK